MSSINKVILVGRATADPEIRATNTGKEIAHLRVATSDRWRDKATGEQKEKSEFHNVIVFSEGLVNLLKNYVKKGTQLYVEGSLTTRKWQDKEGNDRYTTEIVLQGYNSNITLLGGKTERSEHDVAKQDGYAPANGLSDEIIF